MFVYQDLEDFGVREERELVAVFMIKFLKTCNNLTMANQINGQAEAHWLFQ